MVPICLNASMNINDGDHKVGRIVSLHLHPEKSGEPLRPVTSMEFVAGKGIVGNGRYFGRLSRTTGNPSLRQVTLIEREQLAEHAAVLGLQSLPPGSVRSNIETEGVQLVALLGRRVRVGTGVLLFYEAREPCEKMDALCVGLRALMGHQRQGVLAQVIEPGVATVGDRIEAL
jgi:hypothetical protein